MTLVVAAAMGLALQVVAVDGTSAGIVRGAYHPSAVKGQTIELEISAPPAAPEMTFQLQHGTEMLDSEPPFRFTISTGNLKPAQYKWHSEAAGTGCCDFQANGGTITIYSLPRVRAPRVSALVIAGTAHVVGLVVSRVAPGRAVRAWSFPRDTRTGLRRLPLRLRHKNGGKRVYRFAHGFTVDVGRRTEIAVEVAPPKRVFRHGVEVRGRLARLRLTRNRRNGAVRAHRSVVIACTTAAVRKESFPGRLSCTTAPADPPVAILCVKSQPCSPGTPAGEERRSRDQG
jgi:hypothetical protein